MDYDKDMNQLWHEIDQEELEKKEIIENICAQRIKAAGVAGGMRAIIHILDVQSAKGYASRATIETVMRLLEEDMHDLEDLIGYHHPAEEE